MLSGTVMNVQKGLYIIKSGHEIIKCKLRGKLLKLHTQQTQLIVVGDNVNFEKLMDGTGIIQEICERKSKIARRGAGSKKSHYEQIIAANVDLALLVNACKNPGYNFNLIDRYISSAKSGNIEPVIIFNKFDLLNNDEKEKLIKDSEYYKEKNITVFFTSTSENTGITELYDYIKNKVSVFTGQSGVGKSSLTNALEDSYVSKTSHTSEKLYKGRHTTTSSYMYELGENAMIIDTPGMREFGMFDSEDGIRSFFSDIEEISKNCRFSDCSHTHEPGCAVKEALENGLIEESRLNNYLKLLQETK